MGRGIWRHAKDTPMAIAGETALVVVARDGFNARDRTRAKKAKHPLPVVRGLPGQGVHRLSFWVLHSINGKVLFRLAFIFLLSP